MPQVKITIVPWGLVPRRLTLLARRGAKSWRTVELKTLADNNECCPITMVLVLALRTQAMECRTVKSLLNEVRKQPGSVIRWAHPDRPVFAGIVRGGLGLALTKAAVSNQLATTVTMAARLAGTAASVVPHDLRRGAAKDVGIVTKIHPKVDSQMFVGRSLGHSR